MEIDRRLFIAGLGGAAAVSLMDSEAKADALEDFMTAQLDEPSHAIRVAGERKPKNFPLLPSWMRRSRLVPIVEARETCLPA